MIYKIFSPLILLFAVLAMTTNVNAGIVAFYDASSEVDPQADTNDRSGSNIDTPSTTNSLFDTRSINIGADASPHLSGINPTSDRVADGLFYVQSSATLDNHNRGEDNNSLGSAAFHEFSITVDEDMLNLDTLSFNYWARENAVFDSESNTDFTYSVRAHARKNGDPFDNLILTSGADSNTRRIVNENNEFIATDRFVNSLVTYDILDTIGTLNNGDVVDFRLSFADGTTGVDPLTTSASSDSGPDDSIHTHLFDNVQIEATSAVPEPSALSLLLGSFGLLGLRRRR